MARTLLGLLLLASASAAVNNPYGAHLFIQDACSEENLHTHLTWARALVGPRGYAKAFFYGIEPSTPGPREDWVRTIKAIYEFDLIPIVRLGGTWKDGSWVAPPADPDGGYKSMAQAVKRVVEGLPRKDGTDIYIEIWNEPNLVCEWSGHPNPDEYARFFVECSRALRSIGDERIKVANGALSPGGDYDNLDFIDAMCEVPGFTDAFDVWASHPYPMYRPESNIHDGTVEPTPHCIDGYLTEFERLARHGVDTSKLQVIITETGYSIGLGGVDFPIVDAYTQADYIMRAFRDYWSKWPEVLAVTPYYLANPFGQSESKVWVQSGSGTLPDGRPTAPMPQYTAVADLAKPTSPFGAISGRIVDEDTGLPVPGAKARIAGSQDARPADPVGNYFITKLKEGTYRIVAEGPYHRRETVDGVAVKDGQNTVVDFRLKAVRKASLRGQVTDSLSHAGIKGVRVDVGGRFSSTTDADGYFTVAGVNPGTYPIELLREGYYRHREPKVSILPDAAPFLRVFLGPGAPPAGENLLADTSFEDGVRPDKPTVALAWDGPEDRALLGGRPFNGRVCQGLRPDGDEAAVVQWTGYSVVGPGGTYLVQGYVRTGKLAGRAWIRAQVHTNPGEAIGPPYDTPSVKGTTRWKLLSVEVPGPEEAGRLEISLVAEGTSGTAWFDEIFVGKVER